jgi:hypothetical protein
VSLICDRTRCRDVAVKRVLLVTRQTGDQQVVDLCTVHYEQLIRSPRAEQLPRRRPAA